MKNISRRLLIGALSLIFLNSACGELTGTTPAPIGTILPDSQTQTVLPTSTSLSGTDMTSTSITPLIPITGENVVSMQCQFCVDTVAHAVLIFPDFAYFDVVTSAPVTCLTAQVINGQRVLICRGAELTSFTLNICSDRSNCLQFPVTLDACPLLPAGPGTTPLITFTPVTPFFLTPLNTLLPPTSTPPEPGLPTSTIVPSLPATQTPTIPPPATPTIVTPPPPATSTPEPPPTETTEPPPPATLEPTQPPVEPTVLADTATPKTKKPSKTPSPKNT